MLFRWLMNAWRTRTATGAAPAAPCAPPPPAAPAFVPRQWDIPPALIGFQRTEAFQLSVGTLEALTRRVAHLPRPPQNSEQLLSESFLQGASAEQMADAILKHPHLAARLLAKVNAPFHGLPRPVSDVPTSIVYLGLDTVRATAVQCLLAEALRPTDPRLAPLFDRWWRASGLAGQLCLRLGKQVGVSDPGGMVTLAVLSFVGHMAALSLRAPQDTLRDSTLDFLERTRAEQDDLGLCAGELGCLMMAEWDMPASIVEQVRAIDRILVMPPRQLTPEQGLRTALTYYCVRTAERLARGQWRRAEQATPGALEGSEFFHLQTHFMLQPRMTGLAAAFLQPAYCQELDALVQAALG